MAVCMFAQNRLLSMLSSAELDLLQCVNVPGCATQCALVLFSGVDVSKPGNTLDPSSPVLNLVIRMPAH